MLPKDCFMIIRSILLCFLMTGIVAGCSDSPKKADKDFRESYEKNFVPPCISSAMQNGVPEDKARPKCACLARYLTEHYSPAELEMLTKQESPATKKMTEAAFGACK